MSWLDEWTDERHCAWCGRPFTAHHPSTKYCSDECRKNGKRQCDREYRERYHEKLRKRNREYMRMRYQTDPEYREKALERNRQWAQTEKGRTYRKDHARQYYLECKEERKSHTCGFKGPCSDYPFDWCVEEDAKMTKLYDVYATVETNCFMQIEATSAREAERKLEKIFNDNDVMLPGELSYKLECDAYETEEEEA